MANRPFYSCCLVTWPMNTSEAGVDLVWSAYRRINTVCSVIIAIIYYWEETYLQSFWTSVVRFWTDWWIYHELSFQDFILKQTCYSLTLHHVQVNIITMFQFKSKLIIAAPNCGISYHWTSGYHSQLLYLKLSLRWLHKVIICDIARATVMFWILFLHSHLHPVLSNLLHNKQWLNGVLLLSLLKFWALVLNYKCPQKCVFYFFYGFICDFLEFPLVKSSKIFIAYCIQWDTNFKHAKSRGWKGSFFHFFIFMSFTAAKNWPCRFPWKMSSDESNTFTTNLPNFKEFHQRKHKKIHCQFCFLCTCWRNKISKNTQMFSFEHAQIIWDFCPQRSRNHKTLRSPP